MFDPSTITPKDDEERQFLELLKAGVASQRFFPTSVDMRKVLWEARKFFREAPPAALPDLPDEMKS